MCLIKENSSSRAGILGNLWYYSPDISILGKKQEQHTSNSRVFNLALSSMSEFT